MSRRWRWPWLGALLASSALAGALVFHGLPSIAVPNTGYPFAVEAVDDSGNTATAYAGTVAFASSPACSLPPAHAYGALDLGYFVFGPGVTFPSAGAYVVVASDGSGGLSTAAPVQVLAPGQLAIIDDANRFGAVDHPYVYNALGTITAVSTAGPPQFSKCNSEPSGLIVDYRSGAVHWTPDRPGLFTVCLQASAGSALPSILPYTVTVVDTPLPDPPDAGFVARPSPAAAGAFVVDDPVGSASYLGRPIFRWRFGDGAWPGNDPQPFHRFVLPGGYRTHLTVTDGAGRRARADQPVQVGLSRLPPTVRIESAQPLEGDDSVSATLEANVSTGFSPTVVAYRWDLGEGTEVSGALDGGPVPGVPVTYGPGRYFPRLMVVDGNGLVATDQAEVVVSKDGQPPPDCLATIEPTVLVLGTFATSARFRAFQVPTGAPLKDTDWRIDGQDQPQDQAVVPMAFDAGGWHHGELSVRDEAGLSCRDSVDLAVFGSTAGNPIPPRIVDPGGGAAICGKGYLGGLPVASDPVGLGVTWTLVSGPSGATMDAQGRISWTPPPASAVPGRFVVRAQSSAGSDVATATVTVACEGRSLSTCGCGAEGGLFGLSALLALGAWRSRRARR